MTFIPLVQGPKDWRPAKPLKGSTLLTSEERERLERVERAWRKDAGNPEIRADVLWACSQVRRLALLRPDEFDFPPYAALLNHQMANCFALRYLRMERFRNETALTPEASKEDRILLDMVQVCEPTEATLAVRPYVRLSPATGREAYEAFRRRTVSLAVMTQTGERLEFLTGSSVEDHLIGPDGSTVRRNPSSFARVDDRRAFPAIGLHDDHQSGDSDIKYGVFLTKGDHLMLKLDGCQEGFGETVRLTAGIVAARYTVKSPA